MQRIVLALAFLACGAAQAGADHDHGPSKNHSALDPVKQMAGTWEVFNQEGHSQGVSTFTVSSAGSTVRELQFAGSPYEATNMYHLDGAQVVMTHYCPGGNQPRMRALPGKDVLDFKFDSVTNLKHKNESHMGEMKLTLKDADTAVQEWTSIEGDKRSLMTFKMKRKKA